MSTAGPLAGLRVLDLTQALAGPYATMLLADLGADVVKVEPPRGDITRFGGPFMDDDTERAYGGYFASLNRGKRSVVLDLKTAAGRDALLRLAETADALVENFSAGVMDRIGLPYETLAERNPRLVYAAVRGFGDPRTGVSPYVDWPAFDIVAQAMGGVVAVTGPAGGPGVRSGPSVGDIFPGTLAALGVLAAVLHARATGEGQFLDVAMYDAMLSLCEQYVEKHSYTGEVAGPCGNGHHLLCPFDVFGTADGAVAVAAPTDKHWRILCEVIGRPELGTDPRYAALPERRARAEDVRAIVSEWTAARPTAQVVAALGGRVPVGPVNTMADVFADPHPHARTMLVEVEQPGGGRPAVLAGAPIKLTRTPSGVRCRPPCLGEHTAQILTEAGIVEREEQV